MKAKTRKKPDFKVGDRVVRVFPDTTVDGAEGVVTRVLRIGGDKAPVHTYTVKLDDGSIIHPFPSGVRLARAGD